MPIAVRIAKIHIKFTPLALAFTQPLYRGTKFDIDVLFPAKYTLRIFESKDSGLPRNNRPSSSPDERKPVTERMAKQRTSEARLHRFDLAAKSLFGLIALLFIAGLWHGSATGVTPVAEVGDRLHFTHATASDTAALTAVPAQHVSDLWASPGGQCLLDVPTMMQPGGAMTVMALRADGVLLLWAGGATAPGPANCQGKDEILVSDANYARLEKAEAPAPLLNLQ